MKKTGYCPSVIALALLLSLESRAEDNMGNYFYAPLDPGNTWVYQILDFAREDTFSEYRIVERRGDLVRFAFKVVILDDVVASEELLLRIRGDEVDVEFPGEGFQPFYRFEEERFAHRDPLDVCNDTELERKAEGVELETPAGTFPDCIQLRFRRRCADGGRGLEWWCPDVGLVFWTEITQTTTPWELASLDRPLFRRGDANADGGLDVSDPIALLSRLFLGEGELSCEDAADADDNGRLEVTDAISILQHLFVDSSAGLPEPFGPCGPDPRGDGLEVCSYETCE